MFETEGKLLLANWNGESATPISNSQGSETWPQWSPDGTKIAFVYASDTEPYQIRVYDLKTGKVASLFDGAVDPSRVYWLSVSEMAYIAKVSEIDWTESISIVEPDGTILKQVPQNPKDYTHILDLDFSPNANQIAFVGEIDPPSGKTTRDIYVTSLGGSNITNLTNGSGNNYGPVWCPVGDWIAFESNQNGNYDVFIIKPDGTHPLQLTDTLSEEGIPAWRILR